VSYTNGKFKPRHVAKGVVNTNGSLIGTCCSFDPDTHEEIRQLAIKNGVSFAEQVRCLVEWGLQEQTDVDNRS